MSYIKDIAIDVYRESGEEGHFDQQDAPLWLGYAALVLIKGEETTSADVHEAWSAWASWFHNDNHRSLIPFDDLTPEIQAYDDLYRDAIHKVARGTKAA